MELADILKSIEDAEKEKQRSISKNYIAVRVSDNDKDMIEDIKTIRNIKTSKAVKEALSFYLQTLNNKNN